MHAVFTNTLLEPLQLAFYLVSTTVPSLSHASGAHAPEKVVKPKRIEIFDPIPEESGALKSVEESRGKL